MQFTEKEQQLIKNAEKTLAITNRVRIAILACLAICALLILSGQLESKGLSGIALVLVVIAVGQPNLVKGPKYEDLLNLLIKKNK